VTTQRVQKEYEGVSARWVVLCEVAVDGAVETLEYFYLSENKYKKVKFVWGFHVGRARS